MSLDKHDIEQNLLNSFSQQNHWIKNKLKTPYLIINNSLKKPMHILVYTILYYLITHFQKSKRPMDTKSGHKEKEGGPHSLTKWVSNAKRTQNFMYMVLNAQTKEV